jgi:predicted GIY-YIG superfamily endonuclease
MSYESRKYCNGNLYAGIVKDVKNQQLFTNLYAGITMDVKKINYYLQDLYAGIAMDV